MKAWLRSFSFRVGLLIFVCVSATLLVLRLIIYDDAVDQAYADIHLIMKAHIEEIDEGMENYGLGYVRAQVEAMAKEAHDKHLYLGLKRGRRVSGNIMPWPTTLPAPGKYREIRIPTVNDDRVNVTITRVRYANHAELLVGYDLERVEMLHARFFSAMLSNIAIALFVSLVISLLIVWLLNRHLRRFNRACTHVIAGNLSHRIHVTGRTDQFDKLAHNLNNMLDWNNTLLSTVKESSHAIAHDLRTPLSRLRLELQGALETPRLSGVLRDTLAQSVERLDGLVQMFDNLLEIAKAESRADTELFTVVDVRELVQDVVEFYESVFSDRQLHLDIRLPDAAVLRGDKQLLGQAIVNLIDNACKYTPQGGRIMVQLTAQKREIIMVVADNGPGIPPELHEKAVLRFYRGDASRHTKGYGLGLSLVQAVAVLHQGTLILQDNHPGLKVTLRLPQSDSEALVPLMQNT